MTSNIPLRSRMTQKSHVRFCRRAERGNFLGLVVDDDTISNLFLARGVPNYIRRDNGSLIADKRS